MNRQRKASISGSPEQARDLERSLRRVCTLGFVDPAPTRPLLRRQLRAAVDGMLIDARLLGRDGGRLPDVPVPFP
ncbi:hypothetical protein [Nocardia sp. NPDC127526]|uniref:hypothetical protein n=1 Tax=Nocardia sp. NPDC127526 TaxID=3345393 RepID=UPI00363C93D6